MVSGVVGSNSRRGLDYLPGTFRGHSRWLDSDRAARVFINGRELDTKAAQMFTARARAGPPLALGRSDGVSNDWTSSWRSSVRTPNGGATASPRSCWFRESTCCGTECSPGFPRIDGCDEVNRLAQAARTLQGQHSGHPAAHPRRGLFLISGIPVGLRIGRSVESADTIYLRRETEATSIATLGARVSQRFARRDRRLRDSGGTDIVLRILPAPRRAGLAMETFSKLANNGWAWASEWPSGFSTPTSSSGPSSRWRILRRSIFCQRKGHQGGTGWSRSRTELATIYCVGKFWRFRRWRPGRAVGGPETERW